MHADVTEPYALLGEGSAIREAKAGTQISGAKGASVANSTRLNVVSPKSTKQGRSHRGDGFSAGRAPGSSAGDGGGDRVGSGGNGPPAQVSTIQQTAKARIMEAKSRGNNAVGSRDADSPIDRAPTYIAEVASSGARSTGTSEEGPAHTGWVDASTRAAAALKAREASELIASPYLTVPITHSLIVTLALT